MNPFNSIEEVLKEVKNDLDIRSSPKTHVSILYAFNSSGKTRLSKLFYDQYKGKVIYYNAFTEDLFNWDNENYILEIDENAWIFKTIRDQGLNLQIINNFQKLTRSKVEPNIDIPNNKIIFSIPKGNDESPENIKISRGEESIFVWAIFYTVLYTVIETLNEAVEKDLKTDFDDIQYIIIDDPVSSMDDTRIITIALELAELISKSKNHLKFLITTHHALFYNVLFNADKKNWNGKNYIFSRSDTKMHLKLQNNDSPFAYHHVIKSEIEEAIDKNNLKKYHFNLFRALLEKTANFLGYPEGWKKLIEKHGKDFIQTLNHYSHGSLSDLESNDLSEEDKKAFKEAFSSFIEEFKWGNT